MDGTPAEESKKRTSARYTPGTEEELLNEGEYDDVWPTRQANSTRRYQGLADVRVESGRADDVQAQPGKSIPVNPGHERHGIPPRRAATQARMTAPPAMSVGRVTPPNPQQIRNTEEPYSTGKRDQRRFHWSVFVGIALLLMIFGWITLGALGSWWQTTTDDWRYGRPRTFQTDAVVGHNDSPQNPSHFIAMNLNRHVVIIEIPGGNVAKSIVFSGPTLLGPGQDLAPVTLSFQDVNHDGKLDMLVSVQGSLFVFLNKNGTFIPPAQLSA